MGPYLMSKFKSTTKARRGLRAAAQFGCDRSGVSGAPPSFFCLFLQAFPNPPLFSPNFSKHFFGGFGRFQGLADAASRFLACSKFFAACAAPTATPCLRNPGMNEKPATNSDFRQANGARR